MTPKTLKVKQFNKIKKSYKEASNKKVRKHGIVRIEKY